MEMRVPLGELVECMKQGKCLIATDGSAGDDIIMIDSRICMTVYLDNEGMINRVATQKTYLYGYLFHTNDPDWGIIAQVYDVLETNTIKAEFEHVKGHQNNNTP
eukprot:158374-Ditylum_brightwellii.AAC.1